MVKIKNQLVILLAFISAFTMNAQEEMESKDLSFLKGQKFLKLEFKFENFTINGDSEKVYLDKTVAKLNADKAGSGDEVLTAWNEQKNNAAPLACAAWFHNNLEDIHFDGVMDFELPDYAAIYAAEDGKPKTPAKPKPKPKTKYVCIVNLVSVKTGVGKVVTPTLWISYTFYESEKRDKILAQFKSHHDYGRDQTRTNSRGNVTMSVEGSWTKMNDAYFEGGKFLAKQVKKAVK